jgi:hypothetical protein
MVNMRDSEEHHEWSTAFSWFFLFGLTACLFIVMFVLMMIPENPRTWDFNTRPFTPSESIFSTGNPDNTPADKMLESLPSSLVK